MKSLRLCLLALTLAAASAFAAPSAPPPVQPNFEYVLLSGGPSLMIWEKWKNPPHDLWWQNFIRAAEIRVQELESQGVPGSQITWMVYLPSYETRGRQDGKNFAGEIAARARAQGVKLRFFRNAQAVIDYLNTGRPREQVKVADLEYFGHSNKACWMFDYSNQVDSASKVWLHEDDFPRLLVPGIFAKGAFVKSWGCHTGESMSQKFRRANRVCMWGAIGRTQYNTDELPSLCGPGTAKWKY
ncbi:MAG: hypothetical protein PHQ12_12790 [Chthoniobacteraceae bacterium]|nr:hypothetical protein [Chthoniobacteraceae bacterium]